MKKSSIKKPLKDKTELGSMLGDRVKVRKVNGGVIVTNRPVRKKGKPSAKLLAQREKFNFASAYAKSQEKLEIETGRILYARGIKSKHQSVYSVAFGDYMNAPKVNLIDAVYYQGRIGDIVQIDATDDFMVTKVTVNIIDANGSLIEQGEATENRERINAWVYKAVSANPMRIGTKITVIAEDKPGNKGVGEIVL